MQAKKHLFKIHRYGYQKIRLETLSEILKFTIDLNGFLWKVKCQLRSQFLCRYVWNSAKTLVLWAHVDIGRDTEIQSMTLLTNILKVWHLSRLPDVRKICRSVGCLYQPNFYTGYIYLLLCQMEKSYVDLIQILVKWQFL